MSVKIRPYRHGGWEVDITVRLPNGSRRRERAKAPVSSKSAAVRWGEDRERHLLQHGVPQSGRRCPHSMSSRRVSLTDTHVRTDRRRAGSRRRR